MMDGQVVSLDEMARIMESARIAPGVYVYPATGAAWSRVQAHCQALGLPAPIRWSHGSLHRTLRSLAATPTAGPVAANEGESPEETTALARRIPYEAWLAGLPATALVLANLPPTAVRGLMQAYRAAREEWPIFAMLSPLALDMSLYMLCEHLAEDRRREATQPRRPVVPPSA